MKKLLSIFVILLLLITTSCEKKEKDIKPGKINCSEKDTVLTYDNAKLIDVRTKEEYDEGHLDNAINIPYDIIVDEISKIDSITLETPIIVYCRSGARSSNATTSLKSAGYTNVYDLGAMSNCK